MELNRNQHQQRVEIDTRNRTYDVRPLPTSYREPDDREDYIRHEPTPAALNRGLNPYFDEVACHQQNVNESLDSLFFEYAPQDIPQAVREMISLDRMAGDVQRSLKNMHSFSEWKQTPAGSDDSYREIERELLIGTARSNAILSFVRASGMESAELTKVSHPYGYRMDAIEDAREDVLAAIESNGGIVYPRILSTYEKIAFQPNWTGGNEILNERGALVAREHELVGMLVTYKRDVGHITRDDGRRLKIRERQSAAIRIDEGAEGIDPVIARKIAAQKRITNTREAWDKAAQPIYEYFETEIQNDTQAGYLIPLSTMTYVALESEAEYEQRVRDEARTSGIQNSLAQASMLYINRSGE